MDAVPHSPLDAGTPTRTFQDIGIWCPKDSKWQNGISKDEQGPTQLTQPSWFYVLRDITSLTNSMQAELKKYRLLHFHTSVLGFDAPEEAARNIWWTSEAHQMVELQSEDSTQPGQLVSCESCQLIC